MANKVAYFKHLFTDTVKPTAAGSRCRFTDRNGDQVTTQGARAYGISTEPIVAQDITDGKKTTIVIIGIGELEVGGTVTPTDKLTSDNVGRGVAAKTNEAVNAYPIITANAASGDIIAVLFVAGVTGAAPQVISLPIKLARITGTMDVLTNYTPGFAGIILSVAFCVTDPVTTASKLATLNLEIGATDLTGGVIALTSANCTPLGKVNAGTAITALNVFTATDTISVEASAVTAFVEGEGVLQITIASVTP